MRLLAIFVIACGTLLPLESWTQVVSSRGVLQLAFSNPPSCTGGAEIWKIPSASSVQVTGDGFAAETQVTIRFEGFVYSGTGDLGDLSNYNESQMVLATPTVLDDGTIDVAVVLPSTISGPMRITAVGPDPTSGTRGASTELFLTSPDSATDTDGDLVPDFCDVCPDVQDPLQLNQDEDSLGDACDPCPTDLRNDRDGDGICEPVDTCPSDPQNDIDADGICANVDNCPDQPNPNQEDTDGNGIGDACQVAATCDDGIDNDLDGYVDTNDPGCVDAMDTSEKDPSLICDDGIDNDRDTLIDVRVTGLGDPGCETPASMKEDPECNDGIDNDGDGEIDAFGRYGAFTPDSSCQGLRYVDNELIPEPTVAAQLAAGLLALAGLHQHRRRGSRAP